MGKYFRIVLLSSLLIGLFLDLPGFIIALNRGFTDNHQEWRKFFHFFYRFSAHFLLALILFQFNIRWKYLRLPGLGHLMRFWPVTLIINLAIAFIVSRLLFELDIHHPRRGMHFFLRHAAGISGLSLVAIVMLVSRLIELLIKNQEVALENQQLKTESLRNQYNALKNQLDPHFLFNSLSTLLELIEEDKKLATGFVNKLSEVFRYMLTHSSAQLISLDQEISFVNNYVYLLQMRYANLFVEMQLDDVSKQNWKVPPLAIQLLIENAVKHNEISKKNPLTIKIQQDGRMIEVSNPIQGKVDVQVTEGTGLLNLTKRYEIISGEEVVITKKDDVFKVCIPLIL